MNTVITSKEAILNISRQLIQKQGCTAINIRNVAAACGVSIGSIYNYFNSKSDLMAAVIESVWHDIFHFPDNIDNSINFLDCVSIIFNNIQEGVKKYPGFFTLHSISFLGNDKVNGQKLMAKSWEHIQAVLYNILCNDKNIRKEAFNEILTPQKFTDIIFSLIISALIQQNYDCTAILEMIKKTIY